MSTQVTTEQQQSKLKELIAKGKEQGFLTYGEVNDHLPDDISDPEQIEDIIRMINDMGITVYETAPDADDLLIMKKIPQTNLLLKKRRQHSGGRNRSRSNHGPSAYVYARNGHGRTTHTRGRNSHRQAH